MNITLLTNEIDTYCCDISNAYGAIACLRVAAETSDNVALKNFSAELYGIEHYLQNLTDALCQQTDIFDQSYDKKVMSHILADIHRTYELFLAHVAEAPCDENTIPLHHRAMSAAFAAFDIVSRMRDKLSKVMEVQS